MGQLIIHRSTWAGMFRKLKVKISDTETLYIKHKKSKTIELAPGKYTVQAWMDWGRSRPLEIEIGENDTKELLVEDIFFFKLLLHTIIPPFYTFILKEIKSDKSLSDGPDTERDNIRRDWI